jgi:hypothetical protein
MARALHNKRRAANQQIVEVHALWRAGNADKAKGMIEK